MQIEKKMEWLGRLTNLLSTRRAYGVTKEEAMHVIEKYI